MKKVAIIVCVLSVVLFFNLNRPVVLFNASLIYTSKGLAENSTAVIVEDGVITFIGHDKDAELYAGWDAKWIDVNQKIVLPGFIDAHVHPVYGAISDASCKLQHVRTVQELNDVLLACRKESPSGWLIAHGLNQGYVWPEQSILAPELSDEPILLMTYDAHMGLVNQVGLKELNIDKNTPQPEDGEIVKDPVTGEPTGVFHDGAINLVIGGVAQPGPIAVTKMLRQWISHSNELGYTSLMDAAGKPETIQLFSTLDRLGLLDMRVASSFWWDAERGIEQLDEYIDTRIPVSDRHVSAETIKIMIEGIPGQRNYTEEKSEKNSDAGENAAVDHETPDVITYIEQQALNDIVTKADRYGMMVHMHAISSQAIDIAVNAVAAARLANGDTGVRHTIAHTTDPNPETLPRIYDLNIVVNVTPVWARWKVGTEEVEDRVHRFLPFKTMLAEGITLSMGSDYPVTSRNPFWAIETAVLRRDPLNSEAKTLNALEGISVAQAVDMMTIGSAKQLGQEEILGSLEVGKNADLIVLNQNIFGIPVEQISETKVILTMLGGNVVYQP